MILAVGLSCMAFIMLRSVQFSHSVVSHSLQPHGLQHASLLCPSPTPRAYPNSCLLSRWCHPTISSSVIPVSSFLQSFPASGFFPMRQLFASGGHNIGVSASASVIPMNSQEWFPLGFTGWIFLQSKELSRVFSNTTVKVCSLYTHFLESFYPKSMLIFVKAFFWICQCNYIILL